MSSRSNTFYPLLSTVQLLTRGYSGLDAHLLLASDARRGIYDLLMDSSDVRTEVIQLCLSTEMIITLLEERNDNDRSARYVDRFAHLLVLEINAFLAWYLRSGRFMAFFRGWLIQRKVATFQRNVAAAKEMLQTANLLSRSRLPGREDPYPADTGDPQRRRPPFSGIPVDHRGPAIYVIGDRNMVGNSYWNE